MRNHNSLNLKNCIVFIALVFSCTLIAQNETAYWFFGQNAGLNFNSGFPNVLIGSEISTQEGCSTISSKQGQLLFYSDGSTIWNKNHAVMLNGTGLNGDDSSTQSAIIIPKPESTSIYYIFTVDARAGDSGLQYSEIDITLDGGLGGVTSTKNIILDTPSTEKITAVESADGESIWVISHRWNSNEFVAYLVSNTGLNTTPVVSAIGSVHGGNINNTIGYLKASPNREKIASVKSYTNNETQVFDFNAATGVLTNPITIANYTSENLGPYGCEFSPDSKLLYVSEINRDGLIDYSKIHQYNLTLSTEAEIINSDVIIAQETGVLGALQQALDGKIYVAKLNKQNICVINSPNEIGTNADYESETIYLGGQLSFLGLPPFIQSYFFATNIFNKTCFGDATEFSIDTATVIDSITWDFGDPTSGLNNISTNLSPTHIFSTPGSYDITISIETQGETQYVYRSLTISGQPPVLTLNDLIACESEQGNISDLTSVIPDVIVNDPNMIITYYDNQTDAINRENGIPSPSFYTAITLNQTIYVRLENGVGSDCFNLSEFNIITSTAPEIEPLENVFFCNDLNATLTIDVGALPMPLNNYSFLWLESNATTSQILIDQAGSYTVRITENNTITLENPEGCYADRIVNVSSSNIASIDAINSSATTATILVSGSGDYVFSLDNENGFYQASNIFENIEPGVHIVYVKDLNLCGIKQQSFSIIDFPLYFTPNGDTINDSWQVYGVSSTFQSKSTIYIFDRFGKFITQIKASSRGWDGTFKGKPLPQNDYWFTVTLENGSVYKNHFTLKR